MSAGPRGQVGSGCLVPGGVAGIIAALVQQMGLLRVWGDDDQGRCGER